VENLLHAQLKSFKYIPEIKFNGMLECFSVDVLTHELLLNTFKLKGIL
jgi:hypothetical protein